MAHNPFLKAFIRVWKSRGRPAFAVILSREKAFRKFLSRKIAGAALKRTSFAGIGFLLAVGKLHLCFVIKTAVIKGTVFLLTVPCCIGEAGVKVARFVQYFSRFRSEPEEFYLQNTIIAIDEEKIIQCGAC